MMQTVVYAESEGKTLTVDWTDKEFDTIEAIKAQRGWRPNRKHGEVKHNTQRTNLNVSISPLLKKRAVKYAKEHDITLTTLISNLLEVITD